MYSLARFILTGPVQAITVVFGVALLSFPFPFLLIFSSGALALITLQLGFKQALKILVVCTLLLAAVTFFISGKVTIGPLITWLSATLCALVYRNSRSLNVTAQLLTAVGLVVTVLLVVLVSDIQGQWLAYLQNIFAVIEADPAFQGMLGNTKFDTGKVQQYLPLVAAMMTGGLVGLYLLVVTLTLFLGRWWQGVYHHTREFRKEFIGLRLGKVLAALTGVFVIGGLLMKHAMLWQLAIVCLSMFCLQGLAIVHALIGQLSSATIWFVMVYGLLFIAAPQMIVALSALGVLDTVINFRVRLAKSKAV